MKPFPSRDGNADNGFNKDEEGFLTSHTPGNAPHAAARPILDRLAVAERGPASTDQRGACADHGRASLAGAGAGAAVSAGARRRAAGGTGTADAAGPPAVVGPRLLL